MPAQGFRFLVTGILLGVFAAQAGTSLSPALAQLQGGVQTEHILPSEDPFGGSAAAEAGPPSGWEMQQGRAERGAPPGWGMQGGQVEDAGKPPPFGLSLEDAGEPGAAQQPPPHMAPPQAPRQAPVNPNDPDSTPEMQLLWDAWHRRVAGEIFTRFNLFAKAAFKYSRPLQAVVTYRVTRDGRVEDVHLVKSSANLFFNLLITQVVKSLNGNVALLQYPPGSRRQVVQKSGTFTQNVGTVGFRHQTGDAERIVGR
jgi:hypothetical protein